MASALLILLSIQETPANNVIRPQIQQVGLALLEGLVTTETPAHWMTPAWQESALVIYTHVMTASSALQIFVMAVEAVHSHWPVVGAGLMEYVGLQATLNQALTVQLVIQM
jgi:hypothetical protein